MNHQHNSNFMRHFYIIFMLSLPFSAGATTYSLPDTNFAVSQPSFFAKQNGGKRGLLKRFAEKVLLKRLAKAEKSLGTSGEGYGKWFVISGLILGLLSGAGWIFVSYIGFAPIILGIAGLILSVIGLIKASSWERNGVIRGLAIVGIVLNCLSCLSLFVLASL